MPENLPNRSPDPSLDEQEVLAAARAGDESAFRRLVEPHRKALRAHCYRMTGSIHDADDVLQDSLLKAWRGLSSFAGRSSLRSWLYSVATRASLDALGKRDARSLPEWQGPAQGAAEPLAPGEEVAWLQPFPDDGLEGESPHHTVERKQSVSLAFLAALQSLPPKQRAVLVLREVLEFSAAECAQMLDLTKSSVNSALQRARATLAKRSEQPKTIAVETEATGKLLADYVRAWEEADVNRLVALLTADATLSMPPFSGWFRGVRDIRAALEQMVLTPAAKGRIRLAPLRANGLFGFAGYRLDPSSGQFVPEAIHLLELSKDGKRITAVTAFLDPSLFQPMQLAPTIGRGGPRT